MYCNNCGKHITENSNFCRSCGLKIIKTSTNINESNYSHANVRSSEPEIKSTLQSNEKVNAGLGGWLILVGLGLILIPFIQGYNLLGYFSLFNQTYDIPGFMTLLQFEFVMAIAIILMSIYLIYLYFKKNLKFPKYYIIFLIITAVYVILDHIFLASLTAPTPEQQKIINNTLSSHSSELERTIFYTIIWIWYMVKSKRVKATFINK